MRSKRFLLLLCVPLALVLGMGILAWGQQPTQTRNDGIFASYSLTVPIRDGGGKIIGSDYRYVYVAESMGTGATQWRLNFTFRKNLNVSPPVYVQLSGSGPIPDDCVTVAKPYGKNLALAVDVTTLPVPPDEMGFSKTKTWSPPCDPPNPAINMDFGVTDLGIDLQWKWTNDFWNRSEGHFVTDSELSWQHQQTSNESNAALVWGFLFGDEVLPVETGYPPGRIGTQRSIVTIHLK